MEDKVWLCKMRQGAFVSIPWNENLFPSVPYYNLETNNNKRMKEALNLQVKRTREITKDFGS